MPRNVRNYWIDLDIDGRDSRIGGGPVSKDGGMFATLYQRDGGEVTRALEIMGRAGHDGQLVLHVINVGTGETWEIESKR